MIGGLIWISAGIILLPVMHIKLESIIGRKIQKRWFSIAAIILTVLGANAIQKSEEQALNNGTASQELKDRQANNIKLQKEKEKAEEKRAVEQRVKQSQNEARDRQFSNEVDSEIALKKFLKDPDSAEIRNRNGYCGEVNSKNGFGGFTGFKRYIASPAIVAVEDENMSSTEFDKAWQEVCK